MSLFLLLITNLTASASVRPNWICTPDVSSQRASDLRIFIYDHQLTVEYFPGTPVEAPRQRRFTTKQRLDVQNVNVDLLERDCDSSGSCGLTPKGSLKLHVYGGVARGKIKIDENPYINISCRQ